MRRSHLLLPLLALASLLAGLVVDRALTVSFRDRVVAPAHDLTGDSAAATRPLQWRLVDAGGVGILPDTEAWGRDYLHDTRAWDHLQLPDSPFVSESAFTRVR